MQLLINDSLFGQLVTKITGSDELQLAINACLAERPKPDKDAAAVAKLTKHLPLRVTGWHALHNLGVPGWSDDIEYIWVVEADERLLPVLQEQKVCCQTVF